MENTSQTLLVIDDDAKLNQLLTNYLGEMGFQVLTATKPSEGLRILSRNKPNLVILDIMLPEMDGQEVCRTIRKDSKVPILMLLPEVKPPTVLSGSNLAPMTICPNLSNPVN